MNCPYSRIYKVYSKKLLRDKVAKSLVSQVPQHVEHDVPLEEDAGGDQIIGKNIHAFHCLVWKHWMHFKNFMSHAYSNFSFYILEEILSNF